jgi:hypothetical protein
MLKLVNIRIIISIGSIEIDASQRLLRKQNNLNMLVHKNSDHHLEVQKRLIKVKKNKEKEHMIKVYNVYQEQKKREEILKDLSYRRQYAKYRSVSASRNNRDVKPPKSKTYSYKEYQKRMREAEKRKIQKDKGIYLKVTNIERIRELNIKHEINKMKEENQK